MGPGRPDGRRDLHEAAGVRGDEELHWACDVSDFLEVKRSALKAHASQSDAQGMLQMPVEMFNGAFAFEHYIEPGRADGMVVGWFLDG